MKKWLMMLGVLCLLTAGVAGAEDTDRTGLMDASLSVSGWKDEISAVVDVLKDEDATLVMESISRSMRTAEVVLRNGIDADNDFTDTVGDLVGYLPQINRDKNRYASGTRWMSELGVYCEVEVTYTDAYLCSLLVMYDKDGALLGMQRVEVARQGENFMALLVDYDHVNWMTGRFAMQPQDGSGRVIYTKTLGQNMDIVLDVEAWSQGADVGTWEKNLLLPRAAE